VKSKLNLKSSQLQKNNFLNQYRKADRLSCH
jgi:hypothetical protein